MRYPLTNFDVIGEAAKSFDLATRVLNYREDRRRQQEKEDLLVENARIQNETNRLALKRGLKKDVDEAESAEIAAALQTGDLSRISPETAIAVNRQLESAGYGDDTIVPRLKSATILKPVIDSFAEQSKSWQQQAASCQGLQQADVVHLSKDPSFSTLKPYVKDLFFDKTRFNDKDGSPKLHQYEINGRTIYGMVDQSDPVADIALHTPSGKIMVGLNIKAVKTDADGKPLADKSGRYIIDESINIPSGIATTGRSNGADDTISTLTLPELQQKTAELIKSGENIMAIRKKALEAEFIRRSPTAREGLSKALVGKLENRMTWTTAEESPELKALYNDPLLGSAFKNITTVTRAFGGSPKEALAKAQGVIEKAQTLAADQAEGQAFISTFSGIMEAAGKNPENPYSGMVTFFKDNPAMIGRKGAVDAIKAAQTAIASDRKNRADQRRDELGWARVEAIAARSAKSGTSEETRAANLSKRDISVRLRDAQRAYNQAVKTGDPATINEAIDNLHYLNEQAQDAGVPLANVPAKRETAEETEALRQQAVENLKAQRGKIGKFFNKSPSPKAVKEEMERLRKTRSSGTQATVAQMAASHNQITTPKPPAEATAANSVSLPQPAVKQQPGNAAFLHGNTVSVNGQSYPLNPDGTVTIQGRKYRVQ